MEYAQLMNHITEAHLTLKCRALDEIIELCGMSHCLSQCLSSNEVDGIMVIMKMKT